MSNLLLKHQAEVACLGTLVLLSIGNLRCSIEFPLALQLAAAMKYWSRIAKLNAGKEGRDYHCVGVLHDATADRPKKKRFVERLPELLRPHGLDVWAEGAMVAVKLGGTVAKLPFGDARNISQWLRVRGKEAKRNAGDKRHWSEIANTPAIVNGGRAW